MNISSNTDIVVIGGGVIGAAVACYLALEGSDVVLLERGEAAWGSSRRCDGHAVTYDSPPGYFSRFCKMSLDLFPQIIPQLPYDIEFSPEGIGLLVDDEKDMETVLATYEGKKAEGVPVSLWHRDDLRHHEPNIGDNILACLNFTGDAKLNPMRLAFALTQLAKDNKARIYQRTNVSEIRISNNQVQSVVCDKGVITTKKVVLAAGVWTPELAKPIGLDIPIRPRQGHVLVTEKLGFLVGKNYAEYGYLAAKGGAKRSGVTAAMEEYGVAFVTEPSHAGTVLLGSSRRFVGMDTHPDPRVMRAIAERSIHFFPKFSDTRVIRAYAGLRPACPDGKPIISGTHIDGVYVAAGHEGNGIGLSLITGKLMSQLIHKQEPMIDLEPLHIDRFTLNPPALRD